MFYKFNAHRTKKVEVTNSSRDKMARLIVAKALSLQRHWADFMDRQSKKLSLKRLKILLFVLVLLTSAYSFYMITEGILMTSNSDHELPKIFLQRSQLYYKADSTGHQKEMELYFDSLEQATITDSLNQFKLNP